MSYYAAQQMESKMMTWSKESNSRCAGWLPIRIYCFISDTNK